MTPSERGGPVSRRDRAQVVARAARDAVGPRQDHRELLEYGLPEIAPGIVARIARTAEERRWEVIFLTTRPLVGGDTVQRQSQRWLAAHGFAMPSVFVVQRSRGRVAEALELDAVVDDRAENSLDVALDSKARAILVWPGDPKKTPLGVVDVRCGSCRRSTRRSMY